MAGVAMSAPRITSLDEACAYLAAFAKAHGLTGIGVDVTASGAVELVGISSRKTTGWFTKAHTAPEFGLRLPSATLESRLTDAGRAALEGVK